MRWIFFPPQYLIRPLRDQAPDQTRAPLIQPGLPAENSYPATSIFQPVTAANPASAGGRHYSGNQGV